jgi:ABC-type nitrate/sulfonate/bicarbonate transport system permease component
VTASAPAGSSRRRGLRDLGLRIALPIVVLAAIVWVWQSYATRPGNFLMPRPLRFVEAIPDVLGSGAAWRAIWTSDVSLLIGYGLAALVGIPIGLTMARRRVLDRVLGPYLDIAIVVPMAVMMPVVLMALGLTRRAQVGVIVLFAVPFIVVATRDGARTLRPEWAEMARVFGASERQIWGRVLVPGSFGAIVTGLRLGFAQALTGLVTVELTLIALGIGKQMIVYQSHFQSAELFVFVGLLMVQSVLVLTALRLLERRVTRSGGAR